MIKHALRVYADTSVFGGIGDSEYEQASRTFFDQVRNARFELVTSAVVQNEIESAPDQVRELFDEMLAGGEMVPSQSKPCNFRRHIWNPRLSRRNGRRMRCMSRWQRLANAR